MSTAMDYQTPVELDASLEQIRQAPKDRGVLQLIVCRPSAGERRVLNEAMLDLVEGLVGDNWKTRSSRADMQLTIMNSRVITFLAGEKANWPPAGDQLFIDLDLSIENLPPGMQLALGSAVIEITAPPHTGCKKFAARFGADAVKFVNSPLGKQLRMRGVNARIVQSGMVRIGDVVNKLTAR